MMRKSQGWLALVLVLTFGVESFADIWGTGVYGGMPYCPGGVRAGAGAISASDEMIEIKEAQKEMADEIREKKREFNKLNSELRSAERDLRKYLKDAAVADLKLHLVSGRACSEWTGRDNERATGPGGKPDDKAEKPRETAAPIGSSSTTVDNRTRPEMLRGFRAADWRRVCDIEGGNRNLISGEVCQVNDAIVTSPKALHPTDYGACTTNMERYQAATLRREELKRDIDRLTAERKQLTKDYKQAQKDFKRDLKDGVYDDVEGTEGEYCVACDMQRRASYKSEPNWGNVIGNVLGGAAIIWAGNKLADRQTQRIAEYNAPLGYPTPNNSMGNYYTTVSGIGMMVNGLAGAMGGGTGQGSFACNGGANPNAYNPLWGNPYGQLGGQMGGGIFIPGLTPWGMNGYPYGMPGMYPGMAGSMGYPPMMGYPAAMGGVAVAGQIAVMGGYPPMMGGYPPMMGGMPAAMGGVPAAMGGYPPMMGGYPPMMGGVAAAGQIAVMGGYPPMMGGYPPMMGGMPAAMGGMPAMMGGMGYDAMGQMRMQQQMLQYQMQAQQMYMQQQQQALQNEMRRQQTLSSLNMELNSLMMRIQQVQYGYGGSFGGGTLGTSYGGVVNSGYGGTISVGGSVGVGQGAGSYIYNPTSPGGVGGTGCVGLSCSPTGVGGGTTTLGPTR